MNKNRNLLYFVIAVFAVVLLNDYWFKQSVVRTIPYSEFRALLTDGKLKELEVSPDEVRGAFVEPTDDKTRFVTTRVDEDLAAEFDVKGVSYEGRADDSTFVELVGWILPLLFFLGIWFFLFRKMSKGPEFLSVGKSRAKVYVETDTEVTFADVAGVDEAKAELEEVVRFLREPTESSRLGARLPKGILLVGPPGTGKTLLARAVAGEAGVPFFSISGSEFVEMFVGVGAARVRDLFEQAQKRAPCIVFIDELDALGRARAAGVSGGMGGHDEKEQTLNQLLAEMDGFDPARGIVLLGATNRPEVLDPALLRAGRFDRQVLVDRPDKIGRAAILKVHVTKITLDPSVDLEQVAGLTPGFTGADLANLVNEAALAATRRGGESVTLEDFTAAIERIVAGLERKSRLMNPHERRVVAHHEMGHALVAASHEGVDPVHKISIIPRGVGALGYTMQRPTEDRYLMTRREMEARLAVLLGGRAAERIVFDHVSTGASDDLAKATEIARAMATRYAMVDELGQVAYETEPRGFLGVPGAHPREYSEQTAHEIDLAVRKIVDAAFERALVILKARRPLLEESAARLLERETLDGTELEGFLRRAKSPSTSAEEPSWPIDSSG